MEWRELEQLKQKANRKVKRLSVKRALRFSVNVDYESLTTAIEDIPERNLLMAVLIRSLNDLLSNDPVLVRQAVSWFAAEDDDRSKGFTFTAVTEALNFSTHTKDIIKNKVKNIAYGQCMSERQTSRA